MILQMMKSNKVLAAVVLLTLGLLTLGTSAQAQLIDVATLTDDTFIGFDSNADPMPEATVQGAEADITLREGSSGTSLTAKPLFRFDLTEAIDPELPYFFEVSTGTDGTSNGNFSLFSITDPDLQDILDEDTLTWNIAAVSAPNAVISRDSCIESGNLIGAFTAPGSANTSTVIPIFGSDIQAFGDGLGSAAFGVTSNTIQTLNLTSKEANGGIGQARLFTFTVIDTNGTGGGAVNTAATYANNLAPITDTLYRVVSGDTLTADGVGGNFAGAGILVTAGATLDFTADGDDQQTVIIADGGALTQNTTGDFALGDINDPGSLTLNGTATFNPSAGADIFLDLEATGAGTITVNSNGSGSNLFPSFTSGFAGTIVFAGTGDEVLFTENNSGLEGRLELNSTGSNTVALDADRTGGGTFAFNQPGTIDHRSTVDRLAGAGIVEANAPVIADLTTTFPGNERRLFFPQGLQGTADITVNGTATDPTDGSTTLNEFEVGSTDEDSFDDGLPVSTYSGTITTNDFVNVEIRNELPAAAIVINPNGFLDTGNRDIDEGTTLRIGEITVNGNGRLEVGHETDDQHVPLQLHLASDSGRSGNLSLDADSTLILQVSGTGENDFDTILVDGTANLDGTLEILVNPEVPSQTDTITEGPYVPALGDTFDIIVASPGLTADFNGIDGVDAADLAILEAGFGVDDSGDADGDGDTDGTDFLIWQTEVGAVGAAGTLIDNSIELSVVDASGALADSGLQFQLNVSSTLIQLEVVAAGGLAAVPEPSALVLAAFGALLIATRRRVQS